MADKTVLCVYRKPGFNGFKFCGKPAAWTVPISVKGEVSSMTVCESCFTLVERRSIGISWRIDS